MTLIAQFTFANQPVIVGDLLLSGPEYSDRSIHLPTIGNSHQALPKGSRVSIIGITQKVNIIADRLAIGWAGQAYVARTVLRELNEELQRESFTIDSLREFFDRLQKSKDRDTVRFVGWIMDGTLAYPFWFGDVARFRTKELGEVSAAGTGTEDAKAILTNLPDLKLLAGTMPTYSQEAIVRALMVAGYLLQPELNNYSSLRKYYGGGYEIATLVDGKLNKVSDVTYLFWFVDATGKSPQFYNPYHTFKFEYRKDFLLFRTARFKEAMRYDDNVSLIYPILRDITEQEVEELEVLKSPPNMNSRFLVNFFQVALPRAASAVLSRVDYQFDPKKHVVFHEVKDGFVMTIEKEFMAGIQETITTHLQAIPQ